MSLYSVRDVAEILELQEARLRYWAQTGFVGPSVRQKGRAFYTFQDLLGVKVAKELLGGGLPMQRVRRSLDALRAQLPEVDRPLSQLRIVCDGDDLAVIGADVAYRPSTGQTVMSFAVGAFEERVAEVVPLQPLAEELPTSAYAAFQAGLAADDAGDGARAERLYRRAVELDESLAAAWTNLGNLADRAGDRPPPATRTRARSTSIPIRPRRASTSRTRSPTKARPTSRSPSTGASSPPRPTSPTRTSTSASSSSTSARSCRRACTSAATSSSTR